MNSICCKYGNIKTGKSIKDTLNLFKNVSANSLWIYIKQNPKCSIVCEPTNDKFSDQHIKELSIICKQNSIYKNVKKLNICHTPISNVSKNNNKLTISNSETLII